MKPFLTGVALALLLIGCQSQPYYKTMEVLGVQKRDLLVDRIDDVRATGVEAQSLLAKLVTTYRETADAPRDNIEGAYDRFEDGFEDARNKIRKMEGDIKTMKRVADDTFAEWESELKLYQDPQLKAESEAELAQRRQEYAALERVFDETGQRLDPVLFSLRDRVLYLNRNQSPETLARMKADAPQVEAELRGAIAELQRSIDAAAAFRASFRP